jgi:hypothetical protein
MRASLKAFRRLVPQPTQPLCPSGNWGAVEDQIGFRFPADYKEFIGVYGTGSLQSFLHVWNYLDFSGGKDPREVIRQITSEYEYDRAAGYEIEFEAYPTPGCLIPFVSTDDGNYLSWRTTGDPEDWCVVAYDCASGRLIAAEGVNMVDCLLSLVRKRNPFGDAFCNVDSFDPPLSYRSAK